MSTSSNKQQKKGQDGTGNAGKRKEMVKGRRVQQMYVEGMCVRVWVTRVWTSCVSTRCMWVSCVVTSCVWVIMCVDKLWQVVCGQGVCGQARH